MDISAEWLEADGLGGFASGTIGGTRTRRYHALLLAAATPPTSRFVLVNGFEAWVETSKGRFALSSQLYAPGVTHPDGARRIESFETRPWPRWTFLLEDGTRITQEIVVRHDAPVVAICWRLPKKVEGVGLSVRPLLSGRDYHSLHHENPGFNFTPRISGQTLVWKPYEGVPAIHSIANAAYEHRPDWYRNFLYDLERQRGLDCVEDLAAPGILRWNLSAGDATWILAADTPTADGVTAPLGDNAVDCWKDLKATEQRRRRPLDTPLTSAADAYIVRRGEGQTIVAGYPWFTDWGRDTFIAMRGLCLASGRVEDARRLLLAWASTVSQGMLPNRFADAGDSPEFNSVDASLWYVVAVHDFLQTLKAKRKKLNPEELSLLKSAVLDIVEGYARGTRYRIRLDSDGLLAAGEPGVQLTWMDAKVGDWVVTPRIGKPVEIQALWLNALRIVGTWEAKWLATYEQGLASFRSRFWNEHSDSLFDVVDVDHQRGVVDASFRPNQIFAVGGLPFPLLEGDSAARLVESVEARLLTPMGLRSLAPKEAGYVARYEGGVRERDSAYHQGTVWPWLMGPFVEAWVRVRGATPEAKDEARRRFLAPLLDRAGGGHIAEIADGDPPHRGRGCPFQAWSVGEALRLDRQVLA